MFYAPAANHFFRPEEEHIASGEDDIVPPLRGWNEAMKKPIRSFGSFEAYCQMKRLVGLLAARMNGARLV